MFLQFSYTGESVYLLMLDHLLLRDVVADSIGQWTSFALYDLVELIPF
jgi:hypothetical protein